MVVARSYRDVARPEPWAAATSIQVEHEVTVRGEMARMWWRLIIDEIARGCLVLDLNSPNVDGFPSMISRFILVSIEKSGM